MQYPSIKQNSFLGLLLILLTSCTIEGEELCGRWYTQGTYGKMTIEITPWQGQFLGYLLEYQQGNAITKGEKSDEFVFITDLEYQDDNYQNGKIYLSPASETPCGLTLKNLDTEQVQAIYDCAGQTATETWYRSATAIPAATPSTSSVANETVATADTIAPSTTSVEASAPMTTPSESATTAAAPTVDLPTQRQSTFYVIGLQEEVVYDDAIAMEKAIENLWTTAYSEDFSDKLSNITDPNSMYVTYSAYEQPKGKVTITLGYKVKDLSSIPAGLQGVTIHANDYLTYPLSGNASDFEGEGWEQLEELMAYRNAISADFEVYAFDESFNISKAEMWVSTK